MLQLIEPNKKYLDSNLEYLQELLNMGEITKEDYESKAQLRKDISTYLNSLEELDKDNIGLHVFWLVDDEKFLGSFRLNERLNKKLQLRGGNVGYTIRPSEYGKGYGTKILELGLEKAKELGMKELLMDCREDNVPSKKIIEKNGGIFIEEKGDGEKPKSLQYRIPL